MIIPYNKIYFIIYDPGGCGSFIQNILNLSEKFINRNKEWPVPITHNFTDGTAHGMKHSYVNDCFFDFHGTDTLQEDSQIYQFSKQLDAVKNYQSLNIFLQNHWRPEYKNNSEYFSQRMANLTMGRQIIKLLPQSKFIYCKLDFINALRNIDTKITTGGVGLPVDRAWSNKKNIHNILEVLLYYHDNKKLMEEFIYSQKRENVLILDIEKFIFDNNSIEIDKLIEFSCIMDVKKETIIELIHLYREAQFNLKHHPIWDKFLTAYKKLNK
jgi:hypothetical protein